MSVKRSIKSLAAVLAAALVPLVFMVGCGGDNDNGNPGGNSTYTLQVGRNPTGGGNVTVNGGPINTWPYTLNAGSSVTIEAIPDSGYEFQSWTGGSLPSLPFTSGNYTTSSITFNINSNVDIVANFQPQGAHLQTLQINRIPENGGTVIFYGDAVTSITDWEGTLKTLCAEAAPGYMFIEWSGASSATSVCVDITMSSNQTLTANFMNHAVGNSNTSLNAPRNLSVTDIREDRVTINWNPVSAPLDGAPVAGYNIYRGTDSSGTYNYIASTNATTTSYTNTDLSPGTTYYYRVAAYNRDGAGNRSDWVEATTSESIPVDIQYGDDLKDPRDNKVYKTVVIDSLTWMARNLDNRELTEYGEGSWCYNDSSKYCDRYGMLYDWETAMSACEGIGDGWRLSTYADWDALVAHAGGRDNAGIRLRSDELEGGAKGTNNYGFSALFGGSRTVEEGFQSFGLYGHWWAVSSLDASRGSRWSIYAGDDVTGWEADITVVWESNGYSVRCVKD